MYCDVLKNVYLISLLRQTSGLSGNTFSKPTRGMNHCGTEYLYVNVFGCKTCSEMFCDHTETKRQRVYLNNFYQTSTFKKHMKAKYGRFTFLNRYWCSLSEPLITENCGIFPPC